MARCLLLRWESRINFMRRQGSYQQALSSVLEWFARQHSTAGGDKVRATAREEDGLKSPLCEKKTYEKGLTTDESRKEDINGWKWKVELDWISRALEPALQLYKWASAAEENDRQKSSFNSHSLSDIFSNLQKSKVGIKEWSFGDLTVGLYLIYLKQSATDKVEDVKGEQIFSGAIVEDLIYHVELAKGAYKENALGLARHSMLRESHVIKFIRNSSVMKPGYYIGVDVRKKFVIFGIRGTHTVYDLITDMITSSDQKITFDGLSTHFGTAEAARWFLSHELGTIRKCLERHKGYKLKLVGHSLGGAAAALLAIMLRKKTTEELGFDPCIVSAIGFGTPPCVSKELAEGCSSYVTTVVLQDDIIPRLSTASLTRLRNEILQTDWKTVLEKQDWKSIVDWVGNAKQAVSLVQDVGNKLSDYANFRKITDNSGKYNKTSLTEHGNTKPKNGVSTVGSCEVSTPEELFVPGTMYFLKRNVDRGTADGKTREAFTLWKREPGEHFQKILISGNLISDHKCDNHYYALRDVLKGLPASERARSTLVDDPQLCAGQELHDLFSNANNE